MLVAGKGLDEDLAPPLAQPSPPPGREGRAREERERAREKGRKKQREEIDEPDPLSEGCQ